MCAELRHSTSQKQLEYWTGFSEFAYRNCGIRTSPPYPKSFLVVVRSGEIGRSGFTLEAAMNLKEHQIRAALELKGDSRDTAYYFRRLLRDRAAIEEEVSDRLVWHAPVGRQRRSIQRIRAADVWSRAGRTEQYAWLLESVEAMRGVLVPRIRRLRAPR